MFVGGGYENSGLRNCV